MAKTKFTLVAKPTFAAKVSIPVPGDAAEPVEFTFKHRTRDDFKTLVEGMAEREDVELLLDIASGWELDEAFDAKSLNTLIQNYPGAARAILQTYLAEQSGARLGN